MATLATLASYLCNFPPVSFTEFISLSLGTKVAQAAGDQRRIFIAQFRPDSTTKFVSCGVKHVRFWNLVGTQLVNKKGNIPKTLDVSMQTMLSLAFAPVSQYY